MFLDGTAALGTAEGDRFLRIKNLSGSQFNDVLVGDSNDNVIFGGSGTPGELADNAGEDTLTGGGKLFGGADDDTLRGTAAFNTLSGGDGDDDLRGDFGFDMMNGGAGFDTVLYEGSDTGVFLSRTSGGTAGDAQGDSYFGIEKVIGSTHKDQFPGDGLDNVFLGRDGDDALKGFGGNDRRGRGRYP